ncbi:MAG TPA: ATP-binding cassette domain-containing protein [Archangium sp.]|nr:ATP-binding cassette domain-containing protein [Archangium sp.]
MGEAFDPGTLDARHEEIQKLVQDDQIEQAIKRLLDFSRDFGRPEHQREIVVNSNDLKVLAGKERSYGTTDNLQHERRKAYHRLLEIADAVRDEAKTHLTSQAGKHGTASPPTSASAPRDPARSSDFETARRLFLQRRQGNRTPAPDSTRKPLFQCSKISLTHESQALTFQLSEVSVELHAGEVTGLVGLNGSGKSTLLHIIAGLLAVDQGELSYPALADGLEWPEIKSQLAYIPQQPQEWTGTIEDNLVYYASCCGIKGQENEDAVEFILYRLGLERFRQAEWEHLSSGLQMRCALALALVWRPKLLILDEPLAPLDIEAQQLFLQDIWALARSLTSPLGVIISSQHLDEIEAYSDRLLVLSKGTPSYYGPTQALGAERRVNSFEFTCSANREQILELLAAFPVENLEQVGPRFLIHVPRTVTGNDLLLALLQVRGIQVDYFRDLSRSSRQLLRREAHE